MSKTTLHYIYDFRGHRLMVATTDILLWLHGALPNEEYEKLSEAFRNAEKKAEEEA